MRWGGAGEGARKIGGWWGGLRFGAVGVLVGVEFDEVLARDGDQKENQGQEQEIAAICGWIRREGELGRPQGGGGLLDGEAHFLCDGSHRRNLEGDPRLEGVCPEDEAGRGAHPGVGNGAEVLSHESQRAVLLPSLQGGYWRVTGEGSMTHLACSGGWGEEVVVLWAAPWRGGLPFPGRPPPQREGPFQAPPWPPSPLPSLCPPPLPRRPPIK
jgi:hypothetical protein